jgi:hypothetical protein
MVTPHQIGLAIITSVTTTFPRETGVQQPRAKGRGVQSKGGAGLGGLEMNVPRVTRSCIAAAPFTKIVTRLALAAERPNSAKPRSNSRSRPNQDVTSRCRSNTRLPVCHHSELSSPPMMMRELLEKCSGHKGPSGLAVRQALYSSGSPYYLDQTKMLAGSSPAVFVTHSVGLVPAAACTSL